MMRRVLPTLVLALALTVPGSLPTAAADDSLADSACFLLKVAGPANETLLREGQDCHEDHGVTLDASVTMERVRGMLRLSEMRMYVAQSGPASSMTFSAGSGLLEDHDDSDDEDGSGHRMAPIRGQYLTLYFNASWAGGCGRVRGDYHVLVNDGQTLDNESGEEISLASLCPFVQEDSVALALAALRAVVEEAVAKVPAVEVPLEDAVAQLPGEPTPAGADVGVTPSEREPEDPADDDPSPDEGVSTGGVVDAGADPETGEAGAKAEDKTEVAGLDVETRAEASPSPALLLAAPQALFEAEAPVPAPTYVDVNPDFPARPAQAPPRHEARPAPVPEPVAPAPVPRPAPQEQATVRMSAAVVSPPREPPVTPAAIAATGAALLLFLGFALYQRIGRPKALDHPIRAKLHAACLALGRSATARELAEAVGVPPRTAEYHLRYLVRLRLLREDVVPGQARRFAPLTAAAPAAPEALDARVVDLLRAQPGLSTREMGDTLGVGYGRLDRLLKELLTDGRVESRVESGRRAYYPAGHG